MNFKIRTGDKNEILLTGTVISFKNEPIIFDISDDLKISLQFINDKQKTDTAMGFNTPNTKELNIILTNFNSSLGTGNVEALPVATLNNRQLYLNFVVYALDAESNKTIHYSFYLREEVQNG